MLLYLISNNRQSNKLIMIHLLILFTILSGLIQEIMTLRKNTTPKPISMMYALGSIFFIFWHEPFINLGLIWSLFILSIVDFFVNGKPYGKKIKTINAYFCLLILIVLLVNYTIYFL